MIELMSARLAAPDCSKYLMLTTRKRRESADLLSKGDTMGIIHSLNYYPIFVASRY
jgi:hypothetical protein